MRPLHNWRQGVAIDLARYVDYLYRISSKNVSPSAHRKKSFKAVRAGMKKTVESDEHLVFSDEALEWKRIIRMLS